ncbi:MAG TPA: methyltransferase domain-containing protein [Gemmatimonadaceae bacterium]|nr:methyltransferase domain-containing protein [Gemmatimonadaceae bacterium]
MIRKRITAVFQAEGIGGVMRAVLRRLRRPHARSFPLWREVVRGRVGLEIGGPSPLFARGGMLPVYPLAERVDNVNFARQTIWEGTITAGDSFHYHPGKAPGRQYIAEGAELAGVPAAAYDFVLSSHMLEHTANPLRALDSWSRLLKPGGALLLVVPHRDGTFDHRRPVTSLAHLVQDLERNTGEDDLTHLDEILELHDLTRDPGARTADFAARARRNPELRSMHHHVFDTSLIVAAATHAGFDVREAEPLEPYHVVVLARKPLAAGTAAPFAPERLRTVLRASPFPTDRSAA